MKITGDSTLREIAVECPTAMKVLERYQIDYSCGGSLSLREACAAINVPPEEIIYAVIALENREGEGADEDPSDWTRESLQVLTRYIGEKHHTFLKNELTRLSQVVERLCDDEGGRLPQLHDLRRLFVSMRNDLLPHMLKEEQILFPYISLMEEALAGRKPMPMPPFGSLENPIRAMLPEHDTSAEMFHEIRRVTNNFEIPEGCSVRYLALVRDLDGLEADLHRHLHLENNVLFPRAVEMERRAAENAELEFLGTTYGNC
jgi:regulator of cell morphogenesis and NO signaling